jgi:nucleoside phosphorylase
LEFNAAKRHVENTQLVTHDNGTLYEEGVFRAGDSNVPVLLCQTGAGNTRAAFETERAIGFFQPSHVLFIGVAGGLKDVALGDVVAATKIYGYESGKDEETFRTRPDIGQSSYEMIQHAHRVSREGDWKERLFGFQESTVRSFVGPIAAGEKVVASVDSSTYKLLKSNYGDALAVEMEGFGMLTAVHASQNLQSLVVRGISDLIKGKSEADAGGSQESAAENAAAFAFEVAASIASVEKRNLSTDEFWQSFEKIAVQLYPRGPEDSAIWSRSGGTCPN